MKTLIEPKLITERSFVKDPTEKLALSRLRVLELAEKIKAGKTSVLIATGGTEIRGPHAVLAGHTILANRRAVGAAKRLGNALVAPVLPIAVGATGGRPTNPQTPVATAPGAVQMPADAFKSVIQSAVDSMVWNGFKDIFLMGDHGGGQQQMREVAEEMDKTLAEKGVRVYYISDFYSKTHEDIDMYMYEHKLPIAGHGGMMETAEMMYWEPYPNAYIRENYKTAPLPQGALNPDPEAWKRNRDAQMAARAAGNTGGDGGRGGRGGRGGDQAAGGGRGGRGGGNAPAANAPTVELYGLGGTANPHPATKAIGKDLAEIGINNTVAEIRKQMAEKRGSSQR